MNRIRRSWENQAFGVLPLCLFLFLDNYISYFQSYIVAVLFCVISMFVFQLLRKDKIYLFMLLPASFTFILYSFLLVFLRLEEILAIHTPIITEILFVLVLILVKLSQPKVMKWARSQQHESYQRAQYVIMLNEFYFVAQLFCICFEFHLLIVVFYSILPDSLKGFRLTRFLYRDAGMIISFVIIAYEQIRVMMMKGRLQKERWLPVLNKKGNVIGCIAYSVSRIIPHKYYHPIVRVALICNGKLYLTKRPGSVYVSADKLDYPFSRYVLYKESMEEAVRNCLQEVEKQNKKQDPRLLVRYLFENEQVKHQVTLFMLRINDEDEIHQLLQQDGKLWTIRQIEENLGKGVFSVYFEQEFQYLKNTILLAESFCYCEANEANIIASD